MHFGSITQNAPLPARKRHFVYNIKTFIGSHVDGEPLPEIFWNANVKKLGVTWMLHVYIMAKILSNQALYRGTHSYAPSK